LSGQLIAEDAVAAMVKRWGSPTERSVAKRGRKGAAKVVISNTA
jgi:hypothetical protein